jgi:hypothetical protein
MLDTTDFSLNSSAALVDDRPTTLEIDIPSGDSGVPDSDFAELNLLRVRRSGATLVIGFSCAEFPDEAMIATWREQVFDVLRRHPDCQWLVFDLQGVVVLPSGLLGLLVTIRKRGQAVDLMNASDEILEVLRVTKIDEFLLHGFVT